MILNSYFAQLTIANAVLAYEKSSKSPEDQEKILRALEYVTLLKYYAQSCFEIASNDEEVPSALKISDLLICIEAILQTKCIAIEEYYRKYIEDPQNIDKTKHEEILKAYDSFFERVAECMLKLSNSYRDWSQCAIPSLILHYLMFYSNSIQLNLLFHQMLRNFLNHIASLRTEESSDIHSINYCLERYKTFSSIPRQFILKANLSAPELNEEIKDLRSKESQKEAIKRLLDLSQVLCDEKCFANNKQQLIDDLDRVSSEPSIYRISFSWVWNLCTTSTEMDEKIELAGILQFIRLIRNKSLSPEAITSLFYTQKLINGN